MKTLNIGILTDQFISWGGGIDFIRLILNGLTSIEKNGNRSIKIFVFVPVQPQFLISIKNSVKKFLNFFYGDKYQLQKNINRKYYIENFKNINSKIKVIYYNGSEENLSKLVLKNNVDFVMPSFYPLSSKFPLLWAGYIYDFQHKYFPEFFTDEELRLRDSHFELMISTAKKVIVNAKAVKKDIYKYYGNTNVEIINLPFCPVVNLDFFTLNVDLNKYNLPDKYFMVSNQFWRHKDHITACKGFKLFLDNYSKDENIGLVCTGQTIDYRFPDYFDELKLLINELGIQKKIFILGYIPKKDQLQIMKNCLAVIQPTLFEGGPGGGAIYESVAYGIPSIVSNIGVNLEIEDDTISFFKAGSETDLAEKMASVLDSCHKKYSKEELIEKNNRSLEKFGNTILSVFEAKI